MASAAATMWSSLEVAKLVVAVLTPLTVLALGLVVKRAGQKIEDAQWSNRKLVERRLDLYDKMAPLLNDVYCCFRFRGDFRAITPPVAVERKRALDKLFHVNHFLFEPAFKRQYDSFMSTFFITNESVGSTARLRANPAIQRAERGERDWDAKWEALLLRSNEKQPATYEIDAAYKLLMATFAREVGVAPEAGAVT